MASAIDATKPVQGSPTTQSVRDNFAAAKSEIITLQDEATAETTRVDTELALKAQRAGDLGGTATSTTVARIQGRDVASTAPTAGQPLTWDGAAWVPANVSQLQGRSVPNTAPTNGQQLRWNGSAWVPATNTVTLSGGVTATGDASAGAITANVEQLQGRAISSAIPAAGQALIWSGSAWTPTSGVGNPDSIVFRAMTPNLHDWLTGVGEGIFGSEGQNITNAPITGPNWIRYIGISHAATPGYVTILAMPFGESRLYQKTQSASVWSGWTEYASLTDVPNFSERTVTNAAWSGFLLGTPTIPAGWSLVSGTGATAVYRCVHNSNWITFPIDPPIAPDEFFEITWSYTEDDPDEGYGYYDAYLRETPTNTDTEWGIGPGRYSSVNTSGVSFPLWMVQMEWGFIGTVRFTVFRKLTTANSLTMRIKGLNVISKATGNLGIGGLQYLVTGSNNLAFGINALQHYTTGSSVIALGASAGQNLRGNSVVAIGASARQDYTTPVLQNSVIIGTSARYAGWSEGTFSNVTVVGHNAYATGNNCTTIGGAAYVGWQGTNCTVLGATANVGSYLTNAMALGFGASSPSNNIIVLGNNQITALRCQVQTITVLSDARIKEDIEAANLDRCLDAVRNLPVRRFRYKDFAGTYLDKHRTGWLADDVEKVFPHSVQKNDEWFPVLDEHGEPKMTTTPSDLGEIPKAVTKANEYEAKIRQRQRIEEVSPEPVPVPEKFKIEGVKSLNMDQALPTLWGAVQRMIQEIDSLERRLAELQGRH
ncbi:MAG: hypothetical protein C5B60_00075 [Chloroflexi bacterium]|nr:MAG: hypothetical protein C5B60_00075 [Chloroflexota bacterium]